MIADDVEIYAQGPITCSVCAPTTMPREAVGEAVNQQAPTGISSKWAISTDTHFAEDSDGDAKPMPCPCEADPERQHWLLRC